MNPGPSKEVLINNVIRFEYGAEVLHCLSTPSLGGNEQRQLRENLNRRREKDAVIHWQRVKEDYKNADKESGTRRFTPLTIVFPLVHKFLPDRLATQHESIDGAFAYS